MSKSTNKTSDPSSPTWDLMFKNVYSVGAPGIQAEDIDLDIHIVGLAPSQRPDALDLIRKILSHILFLDA